MSTRVEDRIAALEQAVRALLRYLDGREVLSVGEVDAVSAILGQRDPSAR